MAVSFSLCALLLSMARSSSTPLESESFSAADAVNGDDVMSLLQTSQRSHLGSIDGVNVDSVKAPRAIMPESVWWVHIEKCGTSFANALLHHPKICPPEAFASLNIDCSKQPVGCLRDFVAQNNPLSKCPRLAQDNNPWGAHKPIGGQWDGHKGQFMGFFREPKQRLISFYKYAVSLNAPGLPSLGDWATRHAGDYTRFLTRQLTKHKPEHPPRVYFANVTDAEADLAAQRVRDGFAFIGLTDQWALSICLFDAMFGQACTAENFVNTRIGTEGSSNGTLYDTSVLGAEFADPHDQLVWNAAQQTFDKNLQSFGVSMESCEADCFCRAKLPSCKAGA